MDTEDDNTLSSLPVIIPEQNYLTERYLVKIPASDKRLKNNLALRKYAIKLVEHKIGDEIQLTSLKVKKPHIINKTKAKLLKREPQARLLVTVEF